ncbi:UNVERIFIED_CONTAM: hypothetical protein NCL1_35019 [Trichonephila clavipes]
MYDFTLAKWDCLHNASMREIETNYVRYRRSERRSCCCCHRTKGGVLLSIPDGSPFQVKVRSRRYIHALLGFRTRANLHGEYFVTPGLEPTSRRGRGSLMVKVSDRGWLVTSLNLVPLKTRRAGELCTLNLSRAQTEVWSGS